MVLHHVAQRAGLLVVAGARADAFLFGHRDLDVVDVLLVEQRLEDAVGEPQDQDVLDGLLAEVVIDAVDLALVEDLAIASLIACALARSWPIGFSTIRRANGAGPTGGAHEPGAGELLHGRDEHRRRHGEVVDAVARQAALVLDGVEPCAERGERTGSSIDALTKNKDRPANAGQAASSTGRRENSAMPSFAKSRYASSVIGRPADADDRRARRQQTVEMQVVERRQQLAMREVAGAAEDHERDRFGRNGPRGTGGQPFEQRARSF